MAERPRLKREDDRQEPNAPEKVVMAVSVAFTLALFGFLAAQAILEPAEPQPTARVVGMTQMEGGGLRVHIEFVNKGSVGLVSAEVEVDCAEPPPSVTFEMTPVHAIRKGTVVCPPGTTNPSATVASYVEA